MVLVIGVGKSYKVIETILLYVFISRQGEGTNELILRNLHLYCGTAV